MAGKKVNSPFYGMTKTLFPDMKALTFIEANGLEKDDPRAGNRVGGVGFVRVEGTKEICWTIVQSNSLKQQQCKRHPKVDMSLYKTTKETFYNQNEALFFRCDVELPNDDPDIVDPLTCGMNHYPVYPHVRFFRELNGEPDVNKKNSLFLNENKVAAEQRARQL